MGFLGLDGRDSRKASSDRLRLLSCFFYLLQDLPVFLLLLLQNQGLFLHLFEHLLLLTNVCLEVVPPEFGEGPFLGNAARSSKTLSSTFL